MIKNENDSVLERLTRMYLEFSGDRRVSPESVMYSFWDDPNIEVFEGSEGLRALEHEFGIEIKEDDAFDIYNLTLGKAAQFIEELITEQGKEGWQPNQLIDKLSPDDMKKVLHFLWNRNTKSRVWVMDAVERVCDS